MERGKQPLAGVRGISDDSACTQIESNRIPYYDAFDKDALNGNQMQ